MRNAQRSSNGWGEAKVAWGIKTRAANGDKKSFGLTKGYGGYGGRGTPKYYLVNTYRWDRHLDVRAGFMKKSKKQLQEKVLAELANGELVTALCFTQS